MYQQVIYNCDIDYAKDPANTQCHNHVIITAKLCFDVIITCLLHCVFAGEFLGSHWLKKNSAGLNISTNFTCPISFFSWKNPALSWFAYTECRRKLCSNPLAWLVVLLALGCQAMGYVEPCVGVDESLKMQIYFCYTPGQQSWWGVYWICLVCLSICL